MTREADRRRVARPPARRRLAAPVRAEPSSLDPATLIGAVFVLLGAPPPLTAPDAAALSAGRTLADARNVPLVALPPEATADRAAFVRMGVDAVVDGPARRSEGAFAALALIDAIEKAFSPAHLVVPEGTGGPGAAARAFAAQRDRAANAGVLDIEAETAICVTADPLWEAVEPIAPIVIVDQRFPASLRARLGAAATVDWRPPAGVTTVELEASAATDAVGAIPLTEAPFVMAGGNGIADWPLFHRVAAALGAVPGASRVVVDAGLMPREAQIGVSGVSIEAELYLAFGISGAVQHLEGLGGCREILSVNRDPSCPMTARADLSIVADTTAVLAALEAKLAARAP